MTTKHEKLPSMQRVNVISLNTCKLFAHMNCSPHAYPKKNALVSLQHDLDVIKPFFQAQLNEHEIDPAHKR